MSRWWRAHDDSVDHPKLLLLTDRQHRAWYNLMCLASENGGAIPEMRVVALKLRMSTSRAFDVVSELITARLFDDDGNGNITPHNWGKRQFHSDVSTDRVKRFRERQRNVSETSPENREQKTETEKITEPTGSGADAPRDIRADLFGKGLQILARITGKTPDSCRSLVGRWLKSANDEAIHVLAAIEDAERNRVADPVAWINRAILSKFTNGKPKRTVQDAARDLLEQFGDVPAADGGQARVAAVRLLPSG